MKKERLARRASISEAYRTGKQKVRWKDSVTRYPDNTGINYRHWATVPEYTERSCQENGCCCCRRLLSRSQVLSQQPVELGPILC